jgi:D-lactate dehydrogenase
VHDLRFSELSSLGRAAGRWTAQHFSLVKSLLRQVLGLAHIVHRLIGTRALSALAGAMHRFLRLPLWTPAMPRKYFFKEKKHLPTAGKKVVYFPSCINQTMGLPQGSSERQPLVDETIALLQKAGYEVLFPADRENLCCGTIWESKGMIDVADQKTAALEAALYQASEQGKYPVLCDQSPCLYRMKTRIRSVKLYDPVEFISTFLLDRLRFTQRDTQCDVHITCSMRKMGLGDALIRLAERCSSRVLVPEEVGCCGFAGDKGFLLPEINAYALRKLRPQIEKAGIAQGYSNSRTCEIGLTTHSGIEYQSIVYLVNRQTESLP